MLELTITEELQTLLDKQAITEVLHRYCRGIDRADPETLASAYWPDAYEEHASEYTGPIEGFIEYAMAAVERMHTGHRLSNIIINVLSPVKAVSESYVWAYHAVPPDLGEHDLIAGGRYLDVLEKRGPEWRIMHRQLMIDFIQKHRAETDLGVFGELEITGDHHPQDRLYKLLKTEA